MPVAGVAVAGGHAGDPLPCLPCAPDARPIRIALRRFSSAAARARPGGCGLEVPAELLVGRRIEHVEADIEDEPMTIGHDVVIRLSVSSHVRTSRQRHLRDLGPGSGWSRTSCPPVRPQTAAWPWRQRSRRRPPRREGLPRRLPQGPQRWPAGGSRAHDGPAVQARPDAGRRRGCRLVCRETQRRLRLPLKRVRGHDSAR